MPTERRPKKRGRGRPRNPKKTAEERSEEVKAIRWVGEESTIRDEVIEWLRGSCEVRLSASEALKHCIKYIHRHRDEIDPVDVLMRRKVKE